MYHLACPLADYVQDQVKRHAKESRKHIYTLLLVPRLSTLVSRILEEEGVLGDITISSYNLQFIPLDDDVISLEHENAFKEIWVVSYVIFPSQVCLLTTAKNRMETKPSYLSHLRHCLPCKGFMGHSRK